MLKCAGMAQNEDHFPVSESRPLRQTSVSNANNDNSKYCEYIIVSVYTSYKFGITTIS